jgi:hypothetical protein
MLDVWLFNILLAMYNVSETIHAISPREQLRIVVFEFLRIAVL